MKSEKYIERFRDGLCGRTVAVSGSTGGLGRALCFHLASLGARLILVDRNMEKSTALAQQIKEKYPTADISHVRADMADIKSVKAAADELKAREIDLLLLNAGAYSIPRCICDTGYDNVYQINFISPYYLARELLPGIRARGGRIVAVGSIAHNYSKIDTDDVDFSRRSRASLVYGNSKRYLTYSLLSLSEGDIAIGHPGITFTGITSHYPPLIFAIIKHPMKVIFMKPERAALSVLAAVKSGRRDVWTGPRIFDVWGLPREKRLRTATEREIRFIFDTAERIYKEIKKL